MEHLDLHGADGLSSLLDCTSHFSQERYRGWLRLRKDVYVVRGHTFLRDEHFLRTVNNEISTLRDITSQLELHNHRREDVDEPDHKDIHSGRTNLDP